MKSCLGMLRFSNTDSSLKIAAQNVLFTHKMNAKYAASLTRAGEGRQGGPVLIISDRQRNLVKKTNLVSVLQRAAALDSIPGPGKGAAASSSSSPVPLNAGCTLTLLTFKKNCLRLRVRLNPERCEPELYPRQLLRVLLGPSSVG